MSAVVVVPADQAEAVPSGVYAYAPNYGSDEVSVIDTGTDTVTATIPVGDGPQGVAAAPDGALVYVTNSISETVSVIDTATDTVTATIPVGVTPLAVAIASIGDTATPTHPCSI